MLYPTTRIQHDFQQNFQSCSYHIFICGPKWGKMMVQILQNHWHQKTEMV